MKKILIIEDETFIRELYKAAFESEVECKIDTGKDGLEGLALGLKEKYDVILTDFRMPNMNGLQVIEKIRSENSPNKDTPIIVLTVYSEKFKDVFEQYSGVKFVGKPIGIKELMGETLSVIPDKSNLQILIVEDNRLTIDLLKGVLGFNFDCQFTVALEGKEGIKVCNEKQFDVIISDLVMPNKTGEEFIKEIRGTNNKNCDTPIFVVTGKQDVEAGPFKNYKNAYVLKKPFPPARLIGELREKCEDIF